MAKGNMEGAKIHAENAIRQKNQALNYRRMSARIDAVASRVQTAVTTKQVTKSMGGVVKSMESAMRSMNLEQVLKLYVKNHSQLLYIILVRNFLVSFFRKWQIRNIMLVSCQNLVPQVEAIRLHFIG